jgi:hypothetical protein
VLCTVREDPVTSDFAPGRTARLIHGIPVTIYEGFVVFKAIKHTPKSDPVGIYEGFVVSKRTSLTPRGHPIALCLGFAKTAPTIERIEHLWPLPKKVFDGVSFEASVEKGQPSNTSNGLGNSKG